MGKSRLSNMKYDNTKSIFDINYVAISVFI